MSRVDRWVLLCVAVVSLVGCAQSSTQALWLAAQSPTVQAAVYAAAIAIFGVVINNLVSAWNTSRQLRHDREKQAAEQRMELRRDIYLGLAETIRDGFNAIMWWADPGQEHKEVVTARRQAGKYAAQVHLMGSPALVMATLECERLVDDAAVRVRIRRDRYLAERERMLRLRKRIDAHRASRDAAVAALKSAALKGTLDREEAQRLQSIAEHEESNARPLAVEHDEILDRLPELRWKLWDYARGEQRAAVPALISLVRAARHELGETIDMKVYDLAIQQLQKDDQGDQELRELFGVSASSSQSTADESAAPAS